MSQGATLATFVAWYAASVALTLYIMLSRSTRSAGAWCYLTLASAVISCLWIIWRY